MNPLLSFLSNLAFVTGDRLEGELPDGRVENLSP
jgi:hypothetical protein